MTPAEERNGRKIRDKKRYNLVFRLRKAGVHINTIDRLIESPLTIGDDNPTLRKRLQQLQQLGYTVSLFPVHD